MRPGAPSKGLAMEWIFLEALVALLLAVFIVWWTMRPRKPKPEAVDAAGRADARVSSVNAGCAEPKE